MAYLSPESPSDNMNSPRERPSSVPLLGAKAKMDNMRKQFSILPNRMSIFPSKESLKMVIIPSVSPKPGQFTASRPNTSLGFTAMQYRSLFPKENAVLTFDARNVLNRLPRISVLPKAAQTKLAPKKQAAITKVAGDTKDYGISKNLFFLDEKAIKSPSSPIRSSPLSIQNAFVHESNKESDLSRIVSRLSIDAIGEALSEVESEMNNAVEENARQSSRSCASLLSDIQYLDRDRAICRAASRMSSNAIEQALSEVSDDTQIEEKALHASTHSSPNGVQNAVINELDKENTLGRAASHLSIHAIEMATSEVEKEMNFADMSGLNTSRSVSSLPMDVSNAAIHEMDGGQELERAVSQLSNNAIEMALKEIEEEPKPGKLSTIADGIFVLPRSTRSTVQIADCPLSSKKRGIRPSLIQSQLVVAISQGLFASVISGAMIDIQKELSKQNALTGSPNIDMPLFARNRLFASRPVSHFKLPSMPPGNPPILNNQILLAVTVNLCKDVVKLAMTEIRAELSLMNPATSTSTNHRVSTLEIASHKALPAHLVVAPADKSSGLDLQEIMIQKINNNPSLEELATKRSAKHSLLEQPANVHECQTVVSTVPSLKALAGEIGVQHGLLTKPVNDYRYPAANAQPLRQNVIGDSNNLKPSFPSLKDLAANRAAQYGLLMKPANSYQLPSAKIDAVRKKLTQNQKLLLERPGWIKQKGGAKQTKIPIPLKKKSATTRKQRLDTSAINADQEEGSETQRSSSVKMRLSSNMTQRATNDNIETRGKTRKETEKSKTAGAKKLSRERKKLLKKIENGQHVNDKETVRLLKSVEPGDDQVAEMLKEIEDIETLTKEMKEAKERDADYSLDNEIPNEKETAVQRNGGMAKGLENPSKVDLGDRNACKLLSSTIKTSADEHMVQMDVGLDDRSEKGFVGRVDNIASEVGQKKRKKKLSVNKEPDIVPRMNKRALRLQEEQARKVKEDELKGERGTKKKRPAKIYNKAEFSLETGRKENANTEETVARPLREPLRPVRATKATEARFKYVERLKEEAADRERQVKEERHREAEIQKAREISRARALDPVRAKRRQQFSERKPWDPLPPKKKMVPPRLPPIKQTNGVARQSHGAPYGESTENYYEDRGHQWEKDSHRVQKMTSPPLGKHRRVKASLGGLIIAQM